MVETERTAATKERGLVTGLPFSLLMASPTLMPALLAGPAAQCQKFRMMNSRVYSALLLLRVFDWLPGSNLITRKEVVLRIIPSPGQTWGPAGVARRDLPSHVPAGLTALTSSLCSARALPMLKLSKEVLALRSTPLAALWVSSACRNEVASGP
jgi:hypothetical protein